MQINHVENNWIISPECHYEQQMLSIVFLAIREMKDIHTNLLDGIIQNLQKDREQRAKEFSLPEIPISPVLSQDHSNKS